MEIQELWRVISQRWRVVLTVVLLFVSLALAWSLAGPVAYQSQGTIVISTYGSLGTANDAYAGEQVSVQRAPTYAQLLRSPEVAARASKILNDEFSAQTIQDAVDARIVSRLPLVTVTASMPTANAAVRVVAAVQLAFQQYVSEIERPGRDGSLTAVRLSGDPPTVVREGNPFRDAALAGLLGFVLGTALAVYRDRTDPVVRSPGQITGIGLRHLGTIDVRQDPTNAKEPFRRLAVECVRPGQDVDAGQVVLVVGLGGADQSAEAIAAGLATGFVACGRQATLVDVVSGEYKVKGLSDILEGACEWADCISKDSDGVLHIGPGTNGESVDTLLLDRARYKRFGKPSNDDEHIVIAGPSIVHSATAVALTAVADSALVVATLGQSRVADILEAKLTLEAMNCPPIGLVLAREDKRRASDVRKADATPAAANTDRVEVTERPEPKVPNR